MKKADVDKAAVAVITGIKSTTNCWETEGKAAEKYLTYIAGILDFASQIKKMCDD